MARKPDEELTKAFSELQEKKIDTSQKLKLSEVQIEALRRSKQRAELTSKELTLLPPNTKIYESVGRMFICDNSENIMEGLEKRRKNAEEKIKTLENNKSYLQKSLEESENNLREMIQQKRSKNSSG